MNQFLSEQYRTEMLIHVTESLDENSVCCAEDALCDLDGVIEAKHNPGRNHLLIVAYDTAMTRSINLLAPLKARGLHAQLVAILGTNPVRH